MTRLLQALHRIRLMRYALASAIALAVDMASFLLFLAAAVPAVGASALAYSLGIATHWLFSSRTVFTDAVAVRGPQRNRQKALFVGSALVGLAMTTAIVGVGEAAQIEPLAAKLVAIAASFFATWMLRSRVVFRKAS